jgi:hypothetical protein
MANHYLIFSEVLQRLTPDEETWLRGQLEVDGSKEASARDGQWTRPRFLMDYDDYDPSFGELGFEYALGDDKPDGWGRHLWLYAEENGEPGHVAWLVHKFLKQFRPSQCWSLTYATTCSNPRVGEFGGGAVFVTAAEIKWQSSYDFVAQNEKAFLGPESLGRNCSENLNMEKQR